MIETIKGIRQEDLSGVEKASKGPRTLVYSMLPQKSLKIANDALVAFSDLCSKILVSSIMFCQ